ncbi:MAG: mechanosensitive ion channel family protein [Ruthenibacterium sp.]
MADPIVNTFTQNISALVVAVAVLALFCALWAIWSFAVVPLCAHLAGRAHARWGEVLVGAFRRPISVLLLFTGAVLALRCIPLLRNYTTGASMEKLYRVFAVACVAWSLIKARELVACAFSGTRLSERSTTLVSFFTRVYCALVLIFAVAMSLSELGFNVSGIMTGLGLGSLTIALAAQDVAGNFFGGLIIILERPFEIGDWISADVIEGTVEDITFRSTKIRTVTSALTIVPNSKLSGGALTNWTRLQHRLARFTLRISYDTPKETVAAVSREVRTMLTSHPEVEQDTVEVGLSEFADSGIDLFVLFYAATTNISDYRRIMDDVNYKIMDIMAKEHASFAFPTRSIYFENALVHAEER